MISIIVVDDELLTYQMDEFLCSCVIGMNKSERLQADVTKVVGIEQTVVWRQWQNYISKENASRSPV